MVLPLEGSRRVQALRRRAEALDRLSRLRVVPLNTLGTPKAHRTAARSIRRMDRRRSREGRGIGSERLFLRLWLESLFLSPPHVVRVPPSFFLLLFSCFVFRYHTFSRLFLSLYYLSLFPLILSYVSVTHILYVYRQLLLQNRVIVRLAAVNPECVKCGYYVWGSSKARVRVADTIHTSRGRST